jgi:hypothetical protein
MRRLEFGVSGSKPKVRSLGGTSAEGLALLAGLLGTDKGGGRDIIVAWQDMGLGWDGIPHGKGGKQPPVSSPRLPHRAVPQIKGGEAGHISRPTGPALASPRDERQEKGTVLVYVMVTTTC